MLDRLPLFLLLFYAALRVHGTGLDTAEPETALLAMVAVAAAGLALGGALHRERRLALPPLPFAVGLAAFAALAGLSVWTARDGGHWQAAADLGWAWLSDGLCFLAALQLSLRPGPRRGLVAALVAGLALTAAFGVYQRFYGLDYLRSVLSTDGAAAVARMGDAFSVRLASQRIPGQFAYANACAGFIIMLLPLLAPPLRRWRGLARREKFFWGGLLAASLLALACTGSKAGFLVAKLGEVLLWWRLLAASQEGGAKTNDHAAPGKANPGVPGIPEIPDNPENPGFPPPPPGAGRRALAGQALAFAGLTGLGTVISLALSLAAARLGGDAAGSVALALAWLGEIALLGRLAARGAAPRALARCWARGGQALAAAGLLLALAGGAWIASDGTAARLDAALREHGHAGAAGRLAAAREEIHKQLGVRGNYWASAVAMIADRPLRGFGLDNFGAFYGQYKRPAGWEVRRAHNLYLQLAVDGGLGLLAAFLFLWGAFFAARPRPLTDDGGDGGEGGDDGATNAPVPAGRPAAPQKPANKKAKAGAAPPAAPALRLGLAAGLAAFATTYGFFLCGVFNGLGVEFFFSEFYRRGGPEFSAVALIVHALVNWLLLPTAWLGAFWVAYRAGEKTPWGETAGWLRLGAGLALAHFFFDFHYYQAVNSGFLWLLAAAALAAGGRARAAAVSPRLANALVAAVIVGATAAVFFGLRPHFQANCARAVLEKLALESRPQDLDSIRSLAEEALRDRPRDPNLWQALADVSLRLRDQNAAERAARGALIANPPSAGARVYLAQIMGTRLGNDEARLRVMKALYRDAIRLFPLKPRYRLLYAEFLSRHGLRDNDGGGPADFARAALELSRPSTDAAAKLTPEETARAEALAP